MSLPGKILRWLFRVGPSMLLVWGTLLASEPRDLGASGQRWLADGYPELPSVDLF